MDRVLEIHLGPARASEAMGLSTRNDNGVMMLYPSSKEDHEQALYHNLYILGKDRVKDAKGQCWGYNPHYETKRLYTYDMIKALSESAHIQKVLATTDPKLHETGVPKIPDEFIKTFVEEYNKGNRIEEVLVEHQKYCTCSWFDREWKPVMLEGAGAHACEGEIKVKTYFNKTIKLSPVMEETWDDILMKFYKSGPDHEHAADLILFLKENYKVPKRK